MQTLQQMLRGCSGKRRQLKFREVVVLALARMHERMGGVIPIQGEDVEDHAFDALQARFHPIVGHNLRVQPQHFVPDACVDGFSYDTCPYII
jgi:hypothetical protein